MDSEVTLISHQPLLFFLQLLVFVLFVLLFFWVFFYPHVLTLNHVTGCYRRGGVYNRWQLPAGGGGVSDWWSLPVGGDGINDRWQSPVSRGGVFDQWQFTVGGVWQFPGGVMSDSTEPTPKASFLNDVKKQRWCNKGFFFLVWCFLRIISDIRGWWVSSSSSQSDLEYFVRRHVAVFVGRFWHLLSCCVKKTLQFLLSVSWRWNFFKNIVENKGVVRTFNCPLAEKLVCWLPEVNQRWTCLSELKLSENFEIQSSLMRPAVDRLSAVTGREKLIKRDKTFYFQA